MSCSQGNHIRPEASSTLFPAELDKEALDSVYREREARDQGRAEADRQ
jgi:hypothetical protein